MSDNLKVLKQRVQTDIDPAGVAGSILAQNHQEILLDVLNKAGNRTGISYSANKLLTIFPNGSMSWESNAMNTVTEFNIKVSKLTSDLDDFGHVLNLLRSGDIIKFKDFSGRSAILEFVSFVAAVDISANDIYVITVKGKAENLNYTYQDSEIEICMFETFQMSASQIVIQRQRKVLSIVDNTAVPPTEVLGDRYILDNTGATDANWDGANGNDIVEFDGTNWIATAPSEGFTAYVDDVDFDALFVDDGVPSWELRKPIIKDYKTIYIDPDIGNDLTGKIEDANNPFATIDGALSDPYFAIAPIGGVPLFKIKLVKYGTYEINGTLPSLFSFWFQSDEASDITFINNTTAGTLTATTQLFGDRIIAFDIPLGELYLGKSTADASIQCRVDYAKYSILKIHARRVRAGAFSVNFKDFNVFDINITESMDCQTDYVFFDTTDFVPRFFADSNIFIANLYSPADFALFEQTQTGLGGSFLTTINIDIPAIEVLGVFEPYHQAMNGLIVNIKLKKLTTSNTLECIWGEDNSTGKINWIFDDATIDADKIVIRGSVNMSVTGHLKVVNNSIFSFENAGGFNKLVFDNFHGIFSSNNSLTEFITIDNGTIIDLIDSSFQFENDLVPVFGSALSQDFSLSDPILNIFGECSINFPSNDKILLNLGSTVSIADCQMFGTLKTNGLLETSNPSGTTLNVIAKNERSYPVLRFAPMNMTIPEPLATDNFVIAKADFDLTIISGEADVEGGVTPDCNVQVSKATTRNGALTDIVASVSVTNETTGQALTIISAGDANKVAAGEYIIIKTPVVTSQPLSVSVRLKYKIDKL